MTINYYAVAVLAVISMVLGGIWYGPLFGKKWMQICGATGMDEAKRKEMQKAAMPLYAVQFLLTLFQVYVFAMIVVNDPKDAPQHAAWIWAAFIMPTIAGTAMWNNDSGKIKWARFLIQSGYQLVLFAIFGFVLGIWR